ncbi:MAG: hypothetical protein U0792_20835 [Gemmataceae bacterium]
MTEQEWLTGEEDAEGMMIELQYTFGVSERKLRLFTCACCRLMWHNLVDSRSRRAVEVAERFADGLADVDELFEAREEAGGPHTQVRKLVEFERLPIAEQVEQASALAAFRSALSEDGWPFAQHARDVIRDAIMVAKKQVFGPNEEGTTVALTAFLHDIFGNPFRPVAFDPEWRTSTAVMLATQMYESRDFSPMPILANALQDAGCDNADILNHCRDANGTHVRGCWVVDHVLGKT